jgi:hypothetical protein
MMAFAYRLAAKNYGRPEHPMRLKSPPQGYDPRVFAWEPGVAAEAPLPNGKADLLGIDFGSDLTGLSTKYVLANWSERTQLEKVFRDRALGWLYYIQNEGGSPEWGLADDEFIDNGNFPYRLYVREGRRIEGLYTLSESDIHKDLRGNGLRGPLNRQSVAIGVYEMDSHNVQNPVSKDRPCGEGTIHPTDITGPYQIPYGVMVPRNRNGLLVPVAISATHVAMTSVRMEPVWSSLGQAAGTAADLALDLNVELRDVPIEKLQQALLRQKSALFFYMDVPTDAPEFAAVQRMSVLGAFDGDENCHAWLSQPISLEDFARLLVKGLDVPVSITAAHFKDLPREDASFPYLETLYDYSSQSNNPFLDYHTRNYLTYQSWYPQDTYGRFSPLFVYPKQAIDGARAAKLLLGLRQKVVELYPNHPLSKMRSEPMSGYSQHRMLTRGEAVQMIASLRTW